MKLTQTLSVDADGWTLIEEGADADRAVATGSNFLCGNGYLGYRGTAAEARSADYVALVVTDTYDCADGKWRELTTAPNPLFVAASVAGHALVAARAESSRLRFDMRTGTFSAAHTYQVDDVTVTVTVERFADYDNLHLLAQKWTLTADGDVSVEIDGGIDAGVWSLNGVHLPEIDVSVDSKGTILATGRTGESGIDIAVASRSTVHGGAVKSESDFAADDVHGHRTMVAVRANETVTVQTVGTVFSSNDTSDPNHAAGELAERAGAQSYADLAAATARHWQAIWEHLDVIIEGDLVAQAALRFSAYHHRVCTPVHSDRLPIGARGLSCQAYQGSAFWDQEVYNLPAFLFTEPEVARSLLIYRYRTLDGARRKAARLGYQGAYYAWISGTTGDELCPDVFFVDVLTGRPIRNHFNVWQMHISPDVVTTIERYVDVTGDEDYLVSYGAEIAFEVARFLRSFVRYDDANGTYHCMRLLGPDEWHENVDDNAFTNYQSWAALDFALRTHAVLADRHPEKLAELSEKIGLTEGEIDAWVRIRDNLQLPSPDADSHLIEQFKGFFGLEDVGPDVARERLIDPGEYWGWPNGVAVATQVSKQADVAMLLWQQRGRFSQEIQAANYDYYSARCAHGSSLSHAAFGMVSVQADRLEDSYDHFFETATVDLLNTGHAVVGGTFIGGIHTAACAGTYQLAVQGFGGLDVQGDTLIVRPKLPTQWTRLTYPVAWRGNHLVVTAGHDAVTVTADEGNAVGTAVTIGSDTFMIEPGQSVKVVLLGA